METKNLTESERIRLDMITKLSVAAMRGVSDTCGWQYKNIGEIVLHSKLAVDALFKDVNVK